MVFAVTINAAQLTELISLSKSHDTLLAEALWTRYFPITLHLQNLLHEQHVLGKIYRVTSELSLDFAAKLPKHIIRDPRAGGGALLAVGVYPLTWAMMALFESPENGRAFPEIKAQMVMAEEKHASDEQTNASMVFEKTRATAVVSCSLVMKTPPGRSVFIQGEKVHHMLARIYDSDAHYRES
jgi:predicted dehydrogenase